MEPNTPVLCLSPENRREIDMCPGSCERGENRAGSEGGRVREIDIPSGPGRHDRGSAAQIIGTLGKLSV
jgi:hypothetical protein